MTSQKTNVIVDESIINAQRTIVRQVLKQIEQEMNICILYSGDAGSRSYGWASMNSDFDIHMVYVNHSSKYLTIQPIETNFEKTVIVPIEKKYLVNYHLSGSAASQNSTEETNISQEPLIPIEINVVAYDLKNFLSLFGKSNPAMIHMVHTPVLYSSYVNKELDFAKEILQICSGDVSRRVLVQSLLDLAKKNIVRYILPTKKTVHEVRLKVYLYLLHHLFYVGYMYRRHTGNNDIPLPPLNFRELMNDAPVPPTVCKIIQHLLHLKINAKDSNDIFVPRYIDLELFIFMTWRVYYRFAFSMTRHFMRLDNLDKLFRKVMRCTDQQLIAIE